MVRVLIAVMLFLIVLCVLHLARVIYAIKGRLVVWEGVRDALPAVCCVILLHFALNVA